MIKKNILIINANPKVNEESHSWSVCCFAKKLSEEKKYEVKVIDLYRDSTIPFIDEYFFNNLMKSTSVDDSQKNKVKKLDDYKKSVANDFVNASKILIATPYWTGLFPPLLKNWIDLLAETNITFDIVGDRIVGKYKGDVALIQTSGGDSSNNGKNYGALLIEDNMRFYGAKKFSSILIENINEVSDSDFLEKIKKFLNNFL